MAKKKQSKSSSDIDSAASESSEHSQVAENSSASNNKPRSKISQPKALDVVSHKKEHFPLVGIGASAGGLAALKEFFSHVPVKSGMAYVIVVHLSPDHKSLLAELLQPSIKIPVQQVTETTKLEPDHVYVIPPNANLDTIDTHLRLTELEESRVERAPIDHFFRTLANTHGDHAIGVILTGTGSDGTLGLRQIKAQVGLTIVQDPNEAEFDGMPQSAIATGMVDLILPLAEIPEAILRFSKTKPRLKLPKDGEELGEEAQQQLQKIFSQIRARTGRDFSHYKRSTIMRRIARRMQFNHIEELPAYLDFMRKHAEEVVALSDDLLITVTNFFRDSHVFENIEKVIIPRLFKEKQNESPIRVWSVGCATGEEAYSLAMLLLEQAAREENAHTIQVFASDLHERSLERAREGFYPGDITTDVSEERLKRFFHKEDGGYRIRKEVRELVVFAPHNLMADPPFSRMDLISCRNVMIYLERDLQRDVIELFHYALNPEGFLVLGSSESIENSELFRIQDKKLCIHQKRNVPAPEPRLPVFPLTWNRTSYHPERQDPVRDPIHYGKLHQRMVERYAPPSLLVSPDDKVIHLSAHVGRYLVHPGGEITTSVFKLLREDFRLEVRAALTKCREQDEPVSTSPIPVRFNGHAVPVIVHVRAAMEPEQEGYALIIFEEREKLPEPKQVSAKDSASSEPLVKDLRTELDLTRQRLQGIIEEYETGQEELKASNEELQSANEELRSTLEELETSKEELQSMNEELQTVNQESRHKVEELSLLSSDLQNLMAATDIATLFLDRELRIMRFTPKITELFSVRMNDRGRPLLDFTHRLGYDELQQDATRVLKKLIPVEREVQDSEGRWYLTRVLPYRSTDDRIEGVVITLVDITARIKAEQALRRSEEFHRITIEAGHIGTWDLDLESRTCSLSPEMVNLMDCTSGHSTVTEKQWLKSHAREDRPRIQGEIQAVIDHQAPFDLTYRIRRQDGTLRWIYSRGEVNQNENGKPTRLRGASLDITSQIEAELALRESHERFRTLVEQVQDYAIFMMDPEGRGTSWNVGVKRLLGYEEQEFIGKNLTNLIFTPEDVAEGIPQQVLQEAAEKGSAANDRWRIRRDGTRFWSTGITTALRNDEGELIGFMKVMRDQTEQKRLEDELRRIAADLAEANRRKDEFLATLAHELRNPLAPIRTGLEVMKNARNDEHVFEEIRGTMERQTQQLIILVDDLLDVSRITRGKLRLKKSLVKLSDIIRSSIEASRALIDEAQHELHVSIPEEPIYLQASPYRLAQVISNLLNNAARYTPEHGQIWLTAEAEPEQVVISVKDNGIGIAEEMRENIFEMFSQIDHHMESGETGLGIGLTLVKSLLEMHKGTIEVFSDGPDQGTEFHIKLPTIAPSHQQLHPDTPQETTSEKTCRVLVVDDNIAAAKMLGMIVKSFGHEVHLAHDGEQACEVAAQYQPEIILMDLGMPKMDGLTACRQMRTQPWGQNISIFALTGWGQDKDREQTKEAGFNNHLVKPVEASQLKTLFAEVLSENKES
ncbi:CheR family methyltransferase [uncultured Rubinisphaera sp.]|uniref:CheR family methyltransferase n=1 Tax=uncultured Rubinisphaera sp. TaxID=1678686 RepID=UPI0030D8DBA1